MIFLDSFALVLVKGSLTFSGSIHLLVLFYVEANTNTNYNGCL